jgi:hypothetical protein
VPLGVGDNVYEDLVGGGLLVGGIRSALAGWGFLEIDEQDSDVYVARGGYPFRADWEPGADAVRTHLIRQSAGRYFSVRSEFCYLLLKLIHPLTKVRHVCAEDGYLFRTATAGTPSEETDAK